MVKLNQVLELREKTIEEKERLRKKLAIANGRLNGLNSLLESFGVENFTSYQQGERFTPIIDEKKNKGFFKLT